MQAITKARTPVLAAGYLIAFFCLFIGLQALLAQRTDLNLVTSAASLAATATAGVFKLTGWTIVVFLPLAGRVGFHLDNACRGKLTDKHHAEMLHLQEAAIVTGMAGTLWAFIATATNYAEHGASGDTLATLMAILMGLGSTLAGVLIAGAIQAIFIFTHRKQS
ncbi:MAG: hypothetical protein ACOCVM_09640 [Desulfovibrionaceae bacterium]